MTIEVTETRYNKQFSFTSHEGIPATVSHAVFDEYDECSLDFSRGSTHMANNLTVDAAETIRDLLNTFLVKHGKHMVYTPEHTDNAAAYLTDLLRPGMDARRVLYDLSVIMTTPLEN